MIFTDEDAQTAYYKLNLDIQVALADMEQVLLGSKHYIYISQSLDRSQVMIRISDKCDQLSIIPQDS